MLTSLKDQKDRARCIDAGADDLLTKPVDRLELLTRVRSLIRIHELQLGLEKVAEEQSRSEGTQRFPLQMVVHDLKNVLTVVETNLEMMEMKGMQDVGQNLAASRHHCRVLFHMIQDLSDTAKFEQGKLELHTKALDPAGLVRKCAREFETPASVRGKDLHLEIQECPQVAWDAQIIQRAAFNLIANALGRAHRGGNVWVRLQAEGDQVQLSVEDDGSSVEPRYLATAFDSCGHPDENPLAGRGLGLVFCKLAVKAHGGEVTARSGPGEGLTVTARVPFGQEV